MFFHRINIVSVILLSFLLVFSCQTDKYSAFISSRVDQLQKIFAPDRRTDRFDITVDYQNEAYVLTGQTTSIEARDALIKSLDSANINYRNLISTYPDSSAGVETWGVVRISVCNIRSEPRHSAELATQELMGTVLRVLSKKGEWFLVQTPNRYLGWLDHGGFIALTESEVNHWKNLPKRVFHQPSGWIYEEPDMNAFVVSDITAGGIVHEKSRSGKFSSVELPDGRSGFMLTANSLDLDGGYPEELVHTAQKFLGVPYLWGGTSSKGFDCSGYTKTIFALHGFLLPRDASQQVRVGEHIETDKTWKNLIAGDLLFFGSYRDDGSERITHVAMYLGNNKIIHAAGRVKIESLNPEDPDFANDRYDSFIRARRMVSNGLAATGVLSVYD